MALVIRMTAGLTIWAVGFSALYALHGLGCGLGWSQVTIGLTTVLGWALIGTWIVFLGAAAGWLVRVWSAPSSFAATIALASAVAGLGGLALTGAPVLLTANCI